jgi:hypothetical protein
MKNAIIGFIAVMLIGLVVYNVAYYQTSEEITITITDKERITESNGDGGVTSKYLIFSENETFENTDEFWLGKFNASDVQGGLKIDSTYTVRVIGWRIAFLSSYRNIVEIK